MKGVAGVDGCKGGWVVVTRDTDAGVPTVEVQENLAELFRDDSIAVVAIDIPIGLLDAAVPGGRDCDKAARAYLGARRNSVFSPPVRPVFGAADYRDAKERSRRSSPHGLALSQQCFAILGKIDEVDKLMLPELQHRVVEVHPEVTFTAMNGDKPLAEPKKTKAGRAMRVNLLSRAWGVDVEELLQRHRSSDAKADDILDAMAACWTAERVLAGKAQRLPEDPPIDSNGLRMEIVR